MTAGGDISRRNGAKSKGAKTARGKAISSRNATKHGLLAKQPPLLISEDYSTFKGLVQGLIDEWQPQGATEHFLVQSLAMAILRQHRLWNYETAIANKEMLKLEHQQKYPDHIEKAEENIFLQGATDRHIPRNELLRSEKELLERLMGFLNEDLQDLPSDADINVKNEGDDCTWLEAVVESLGGAYHHKDRSSQVYVEQDKLYHPLCALLEKDGEVEYPKVDEIALKLRTIIVLAKERIADIDKQVAEIERSLAAISDNEMLIQSIQKPLLIAKYQADLSREVKGILEQLRECQQNRSDRQLASTS